MSEHDPLNPPTPHEESLEPGTLVARITEFLAHSKAHGQIHTCIPTDLVAGMLAVMAPVPDFQDRVRKWTTDCFGATVAADTIERNHRFLEESLELVQSLGCTQDEAHQIVDYVFGRDIGDANQEIGGVMVTLAALANAHHWDVERCAESELLRANANIQKIRAKQAAKPKFSPLPVPTEKETAPGARDEYKDALRDCGSDILKTVMEAMADPEGGIGIDQIEGLIDGHLGRFYSAPVPAASPAAPEDLTPSAVVRRLEEKTCTPYELACLRHHWFERDWKPGREVHEAKIKELEAKLAARDTLTNHG